MNNTPLTAHDWAKLEADGMVKRPGQFSPKFIPTIEEARANLRKLAQTTKERPWRITPKRQQWLDRIRAEEAAKKKPAPVKSKPKSNKLVVVVLDAIDRELCAKVPLGGTAEARAARAAYDHCLAVVRGERGKVKG